MMSSMSKNMVRLMFAIISIATVMEVLPGVNSEFVSNKVINDQQVDLDPSFLFSVQDDYDELNLNIRLLAAGNETAKIDYNSTNATRVGFGNATHVVTGSVTMKANTEKNDLSLKVREAVCRAIARSLGTHPDDCFIDEVKLEEDAAASGDSKNSTSTSKNDTTSDSTSRLLSANAKSFKIGYGIYVADLDAADALVKKIKEEKTAFEQDLMTHLKAELLKMGNTDFAVLEITSNNEDLVAGTAPSDEEPAPAAAPIPDASFAIGMKSTNSLFYNAVIMVVLALFSTRITTTSSSF